MTTDARTQRLRRRAGFTLIEIMLVLGIISLLLGLAVYQLGGAFGGAKDVAARANIQTLRTALMNYSIQANRFPTTEQGLKALAVKPTNPPLPKRWSKFLPEIPLDPWDHEFQYRYPGVKNPDSYDIFSMGEDGLPDTEDDIGNW
jgi:general secretion pathway protein G